MPQNNLTEQEQAAFINKTIQEWLPIAQRELDKALDKVDGKVPSSTRADLRFQLRKATESQAAEILLSFKDESRIVEMKNVDFARRPISRESHFIYEWAKKKGISKFRKGVPGYSKKPKHLSEEQQLMRIANAIVIAKQKGTGRKRRRRRWFNKTYYGQIQELVEKLIKEQGEFAREVIKGSLNS